MERQIIQTSNEKEWLELRTRDITSTESSALFGINPYLTLFELWHRKKEGNIVIKESNEFMKWGNRFEDAIAQGIAEDFGIGDIRPMKEYITIPKLRLGSSFDYAIGEDGILEIKNVGFYAYKRGWTVDNGEVIEAPVWIESQVQHQLLVSGRQYAYIGACIGGDQGVLIRRNRDESVIKAIQKKTKEFWESIDDNMEPTPDFEKDAEFISSLYNYAETGKVIEVEDSTLNNMAMAYGELGENIKELTARREGLKAKILMTIQDAEKVKGNGWTISAGMIAPKEISYVRKGYRQFRISYKENK